MVLVNINEIKPNPNNPRVIKDDKFKKLVKSIKDFPDMLNKRPLICFTDIDNKYCVLGGNMRLKACKQIGLKEIPIIIADDWSEEQKAEFLIKDNVGFGEWIWEDLTTNWNIEKLTNWGLDVPKIKDSEQYTTKINSPIYEPKGPKPLLNELFDITKYNDLLNEINNSKLSNEEKEFLKIASTRHIVFNYKNIAEYYAHSEKETQNQFENNALVIIDYDKAIELGFVKLFSTLENLSEIDE
jgi:hypothetical protein